MMIRQSTRHEEKMKNRERGWIVEWSEHPEVENIGVVRACRSMAHIACTRRTETISMLNKEEMGRCC
jgi:hypothetical protein